MISDARPRSGFTLFEVVLATALAAVLVGLLGMALHVYLESVSVGRGDVEQAQLARAVLARIAGDLRAAVRRTEQDLSALSEGGESGGAVGEGFGDSSGSGGAGGVGGLDGAAASGGSPGLGDSMSGSDLASTAIPSTEPGLYGNAEQLLVDISRIPRFDELDALLQLETPPSGHASDLRTVAYYVQQGEYVEASASASTALGQSQQRLRSGLMRREMDRATALFSADLGGSELMSQEAKLLAPEVTRIQFQYFDGTQLWQDWDSTAQGGLPMAVEVRIWLRPPMRDAEADAAAAQSIRTPGEDDQMYRMVVHLPAAAPASATGEASSGGATGTNGSGSSTVFGTGGE